MRVAGQTLSAALLVAGCGFHPAGGAGNGDPTDAALTDAVDLPWWDAAYRHRIALAVTAGPTAPLGGYLGYTARLVDLDTAALIGAGRLRVDCADLRLVRWSGAEWSELDRHLIGCGGAGDLRFMLAADIAAGATDRSYYLYLGNPDAAPPAPLRTTNVYLWFDDASSDRSRAYDRGRFDSWGSTNTWEDALAWIDDAYAYLRADDQVSSYRRRVAERDVYVEAQLLHTACFPGNMATGMVVRGLVTSGSGGSEEADHYYASMRAEQSACGEGYAFDGDIVAAVRDQSVVDGVDPPAVPNGAWRAQALAAWGADPTHLAFWDLDGAWPTPGWPPASALTAAGDHGAEVDHDQAGFAGVWMAQDAGSFRDLLIRRYVDPEPTLTAGSLETAD